jgi:hypothetical protein
MTEHERDEKEFRKVVVVTEHEGDEEGARNPTVPLANGG